MKKTNKILIITLSFFILSIFTNNIATINLESTIEEDFFVGLDENGNIINMLDNVSEIEKPKMRMFSFNANYEVIDKDTNEKVAQFNELDEAIKYTNDNMQRNLNIQQFNSTVSVTYGIVNFRTKSEKINTNFIEQATGKSNYTNGHYAADGAFLGYTSDNKVIFKMAGTIGYVDPSDVQIVDYDDTNIVSKYYTTNNRLYHGIVNDITRTSYGSSQDVGPMPSYLKNNTTYYSYDGHYFYPNFKIMIDDYKNNTYKNSLNENSPYYNYYQFLSHRSSSSISAISLNNYLTSKTKENSKLRDMGESFKTNEKKYGVNALLMLGVAINESNWGVSNIALTKNNLFGHNAYDSTPGESASGYDNPKISIEVHASRFISDGYLDPCDGYAVYNNGYNTNSCNKGRYRGAHLGDKASGINVKYASDPYWGEKAASQVYQLEKAGLLNDYASETIAIKVDTTILNIRSLPNTTSESKLIYQTGNTPEYTFKVLGSATGTVVNGSNVWYKIQSDPVLPKDRSRLIQNSSTVTNTYDMENMYGYIHSSYVNIVNEGKPITPDPNPDPDPKPEEPKYKLGDVNNDGNINALDYVLIKSHMLGRVKLTDTQKLAADINKDGNINALDYIRIKNHMLNRKPGIE